MERVHLAESLDELRDTINTLSIGDSIEKYGYDFPFEIEGRLDLIDYAGFDYIGTYEYEKMVKHLVLRDESNFPTNMLLEKINEFVKAKNIYLPNDHIGIFLASPQNQHLFEKISFEGIIVSYNKANIRNNLD
ncbi:2465_t:CDS:2, partial [Racocetra persica]